MFARAVSWHVDPGPKREVTGLGASLAPLLTREPQTRTSRGGSIPALTASSTAASISPIYRVAGTNFDHQYPQGIVLNVADYAAISYSIPPQLTQRARERLAQAPWILHTRDSLVHVIDNASSCLPVELAKLILGGGGVLNRPSQGHFLRHRRSTLSLSPDEASLVHRRQGSSPPCPPSRARSPHAGRMPSCARSGRPEN